MKEDLLLLPIIAIFLLSSRAWALREGIDSQLYYSGFDTMLRLVNGVRAIHGTSSTLH